MILCECGEFIRGETFKDYICTSANPSTATVGHKKCGILFDFIDNTIPKKYSSKKELKSIAIKFAEIKNMDQSALEQFLIEVDRLKTLGTLSDYDLLMNAYGRL